MICAAPVGVGTNVFGCGRCIPCLVNRRRLWATRLYLEGLLHPAKAFVTLTYSDETVPLTSKGRMEVRPEDLRNFMKRLRERVRPKRLRFYGVGEYGDETQRPHYHVVLYGYGCCVRGQTVYDEPGGKCCIYCDTINAAWNNGRISSEQFEIGLSRYVCGYVTKKMTRFDDARLEGRHPEFARMSNRPGIGALVGDEFGFVRKRNGQADIGKGEVRINGKKFGIGRYLSERARQSMGVEKDNRSWEAEMRGLLLRSIGNEVSVAEQARMESAGKAALIESNVKLYGQRKKL